MVSPIFFLELQAEAQRKTKKIHVDIIFLAKFFINLFVETRGLEKKPWFLNCN